MARTKLAGGVALAAAGLMAVAACSSSSSSSAGGGSKAGSSSAASSSSSSGSSVSVAGSVGSIPAPASTQKAGTITFGQLESAGANHIMPNATSGNNSVYNVNMFTAQMWPYLYWVPNGVSPKEDPSLSIANDPVYSNNNKTMTIKLKNWNWSDGAPVTSTDLEFTIDQLKAGLKLNAANWAGYTPGYFPDTVTTMSTPDAKTLVINLSKAANPQFNLLYILSSIQIEPSLKWAKTSASGSVVPQSQWSKNNGVNKTAEAIYKFITAQDKDTSTYATNPLWQTVYGPYKISAYDSSNRQSTLVPNTSYSGPHVAKMSTVKFLSYTSSGALWDAVLAKQVDVLPQPGVPSADLPQLSKAKSAGYDWFGEPVFGSNVMIYNFKDKANGFGKVIGQDYIRQALAHVEDQKGQIKAFLDGYGGEAYSTVPKYPANPYTPSDLGTNPYPFSVTAAENLLKQHGWTVTPGGTDVCSSPGSGANQCGAGIAKGAKLQMTIDYYAASKFITHVVTNFAQDAGQAGIKITLKPDGDFNKMISNYNDPASPSTVNKWEIEDFGGWVNSQYATAFGILNSKGSENMGGYSNPTADKLINSSVNGTDPNAVAKEVDFFAKAQPYLFEPLGDTIVLWNNTISASTPKAIEALTQAGAEPQFMYFSK